MWRGVRAATLRRRLICRLRAAAILSLRLGTAEQPTYLYVAELHMRFIILYTCVYMYGRVCMHLTCTRRHVLTKNHYICMYTQVSNYNYEKYPLSPLKPRGLAPLSWHVPYNWGSWNSVHQSFTWFLSLNWLKSTFYRSRVPISFQN